MTLPWDEFQPEVVESQPITPEPEPEPYVPPSNLPEKPSATIDFGKILKDAFSEALQEAGEKLKDTGTGYVRDSFDAIREGETVDVLHPTVTAETSTGRQLVIADAKSRSGRTFVQGLIIDLTAAIIAVLVSLGTTFDPTSKEAWIVLGALIIKTFLQTIISFVMRLKVTPTIKTPGERMAIMPVPRPMMEGENHDKPRHSK